MDYVYIPLFARVSYLYWHGTSSINLQSILHNGLRFSDKNAKLYDPGTEAEALASGVYLSLDPSLAYHYADQSAKKYKSNPVLVACTISMGHDTLPDEDAIVEALYRAYKEENLSNFLRQFCKSFGKLYGVKVSTLKPLIAKNRFLLEALTLLFRDKKKSKQNIATLMKYLGRVSSSFSHKKRDQENNIVITTPIKYKGHRKIVGIWERSSRVNKRTKTKTDEGVLIRTKSTEHWNTVYGNDSLFIENLAKLFGGKSYIPTLYLNDVLINKQKRASY